MPHITNATKNVVSGITTFLVGIGFSIYLLGGYETILGQMKRVSRNILPDKVCNTGTQVFRLVTETLGNYVIGQGTEALILGSLCFVGMSLLRLDYAGMISAVVTVTALIPILGAWIGGGLAVILLFIVSPRKALFFVIFFVVLQWIENNFIYPRVVGKKVGIPGIWVLFGITVGGKAAGIAGMLFAVPVASVIYVLIKTGVTILEKKNKDLKPTNKFEEN